MIDEQLREHVARQVYEIDVARGDYAEVVRRGARRKAASRALSLAALFLALAGLVSIVTQLPTGPVAQTPPQMVSDRHITVNPGEGPGGFAEELARGAGPPSSKAQRITSAGSTQPKGASI